MKLSSSLLKASGILLSLHLLSPLSASYVNTLDGAHAHRIDPIKLHRELPSVSVKSTHTPMLSRSMASEDLSKAQGDCGDIEKNKLHENFLFHSNSAHSPSSSSQEQREANGKYRGLHHQSTSEPIVHEKGVDPDQKTFYDDFAARDHPWHVKTERRLLTKVDWHLLPLLIIMYLLNFLDRK